MLHQDTDDAIAERNRELDRVAAEIEEAYSAALSSANQGARPKPLTAQVISASLSNLGHTSTGAVVFTTATLSSLNLSSVDALATFRHLQKINLDMNQLTSVAALKDCDALVHLSLSRNLLTETVFAELRGTADTLQHLDVSHNQITALTGACYYTYLNTLLADGNQITSIKADGEVGALQSLWKLGLSENHISNIERGAFRDCPLRILDLAKNEVAEIAPLLDLAGTLTWLGLDDNNVMHMHDLVKFAKLTTLRLAGNNIYDMCETHMLSNIESLRVLALLGNPLCSFGAMPTAPIDDDADSDIVRRDDDGVTADDDAKRAPPRMVKSATFAAALRKPENAPYQPTNPQDADEQQLASLSEEARYRLHVLWRVPQLSSLDGVDITSAEAADAKNLVGGVDREQRKTAEKLVGGGPAASQTRPVAAAGSGARAVRNARN